MSISEQNEPCGANAGPSPTHTVTVVAGHEGEDGMGSRNLTVGRYEEIRRRLAEGRGVREIARALSCAGDTVREVRDGLRHSPMRPSPWLIRCGCCSWSGRSIHDLRLGHPLKLIWEEKAQQLTTYSNFWKQFYRKFR